MDPMLCVTCHDLLARRSTDIRRYLGDPKRVDGIVLMRGSTTPRQYARARHRGAPALPAGASVVTVGDAPPTRAERLQLALDKLERRYAMVVATGPWDAPETLQRIVSKVPMASTTDVGAALSPQPRPSSARDASSTKGVHELEARYVGLLSQFETRTRQLQRLQESLESDLMCRVEQLAEQLGRLEATSQLLEKQPRDRFAQSLQARARRVTSTLTPAHGCKT